MASEKDWKTVAETETSEDDILTEQQANEREVLDDLAEQEQKLAHDVEDIKALQRAIEAAEQKASENWEKMLRAVSDLENTRRRAERDIENAHKYSLEKFIKELIPVVDSMDHALENVGKEASEHLEGIQLTHKMLLDVLAKFSVTPLNPVGESFDPKLHEAMSAQESDQEAGTILVVFQKGYVLNDRVVRPARVIVAK